METKKVDYGIFKDAINEAAFLKLGFYGGSGSGKTYTASKVAIGLVEFIKSKKPVFFLDSETGSDYVMGLFKKAKIVLKVAKSRAFSDLMDTLDIAEKYGSVFLVDSITHYWDDLVESYKKKKNIKRMFVQHWMELKPEWREFSAKFVSSSVHIILCGRSGDIWQDVEDSDGIKELKKVGTKMRVEKELGYEPSLLVEMDKVIKEKGWTHRAFVEKDRFDILNFKLFDNPTFENFLPHIELLNIGGKHRALDVERDSQDMFKDNSGAEYYKKREQTLEKIKNEINLLFPGRDEKTKVDRINLTKDIFKTHSWAEICEMDVVTLMNGLIQIEEMNSKKDKVVKNLKESKTKKETKNAISD